MMERKNRQAGTIMGNSPHLFTSLFALRRGKQQGLRAGFCALILSASFAVAASAFTVDNTTYQFHQNPAHPAYEIARAAMKDVYKNAPKGMNPLIGIAEIDLDRDRLPEIIAYPTEDYEEDGMYCDPDTTLCPHFILQVREDNVRTLGVIYSRYISRGDDVVGGFWTLKAWNKGEKDPSYYDIYVYDRQKDEYVPQAAPR